MVDLNSKFVLPLNNMLVSHLQQASESPINQPMDNQNPLISSESLTPATNDTPNTAQKAQRLPRLCVFFEYLQHHQQNQLTFYLCYLDFLML